MPIKARGVHTEHWAKWHEKSRRIVQLRAGFKCESCQTNLRPLEWAHLVGRGNIISEPWCSTPELTAGLCTGRYGELGCHEKIDRNLAPDLLRDLRQLALIRLMQRFPELRMLNFGAPLDGIREAVRLLEASDWVYDAQHNSIVYLPSAIEEE